VNVGVILVAAIGYLLGSISFARIVAAIVDPSKDVTKWHLSVPNTDLTYEDDAASATLVNLNIGARYGCLTSILDMVKVIVPMLILERLAPSQPYALIVSAAAMVGHNWPIYHHFHGGRGESVVYGSMLVIDPLGPVVTNVVAGMLGFLSGSVHVLRWGGMILLIPWVWWRTGGDPAYVAYIVFMNAAFLFAMRKDWRQYVRFHKAGAFPDQASLSTFLDMGSELGRSMDRYSIPALARRLSGTRGR
jgi:glycerol-3-phosphate acyltransferase PlsY